MSRHASPVATDLMDEPHVSGHRVSVRRIHAQVEERGASPAAVAADLELDVAEVYHALAYYHDNPDQMAAVERRRTDRLDDAADRGAVTGPDDL